MRCCYHVDYFLPLPPGHPFPMAKYPLLYERLVGGGTLDPRCVIEPGQCRLEDLRLVHTAAYLEQLACGTLDAAAQRRIGVPWSPKLWRRSRLAAQGTIEAARAALADGVAGNLAGGTHHAFADHGDGCCVLNDVAVASRVSPASKRTGIHQIPLSNRTHSIARRSSSVALSAPSLRLRFSRCVSTVLTLR